MKIQMPTTRNELTSLVSRHNHSHSATVRESIQKLFTDNNNTITVDGLAYSFNGIDYIAIVPTKSQPVETPAPKSNQDRMVELVAMVRDGKASVEDRQELASLVAGLL